MREDWTECILDDLLVLMTNGSSAKQFEEEIGLPISRIETIWDEKIDFERVKYIKESEPDFIEKYQILKNDILLSHINSDSHLGKTAIYKNENKVFIHGINLLKLRPSPEINADFLLHQFRFKKIKGDFIAVAQRAVNQSSINQRKLKVFDFTIAPLPEQRAIVAKIEELFSDLDKGIADLKKAQDQLKVYRQAVLKKAFEGELTKEWREQQQDLPTADELLEQIKEERQKHYEQQLENWKQAVKAREENGNEGKKPGKPKFLKELEEFTDEDLFELHELDSYWNWVKVDKLCQYDQSAMKAGPFGSSLKKAFYTESGYKIYGQEQVISGDYKFGNYYVNNEKYQSLINCAVKPHDVLISLVGTVGKVLILPEDCEAGLINPRLVKFSLNDFYSEQFFKYFFESGFIKSIYKLKNHGTTMDVLNLGIIKELPFPLCSKKEQHQIVQEIESRLSVCDKVEESITESLEKAKALRQSVLKKAFEDTLLSEEEIAACKAAPDYEPASVLLEKIKAEKKKK